MDGHLHLKVLMKDLKFLFLPKACMTENRQRCIFPFLFNENDDALNRRCAKNTEVSVYIYFHIRNYS